MRALLLLCAPALAVAVACGPGPQPGEDTVGLDEATEGSDDAQPADEQEEAPCALAGQLRGGLSWYGSYETEELTLDAAFEEQAGASGNWSPCSSRFEETHVLSGTLDGVLLTDGIHNGDEVCFITGESYGMRAYSGTVDEDCRIDGSWSDHSGSGSFWLEPVAAAQ